MSLAIASRRVTYTPSVGDSPAGCATRLRLGRTPPAAEGLDQLDAGVHLEVDRVDQRQLVCEQRALGVEDNDSDFFYAAAQYTF